MNIFDIIGPIMIGPSSSHTAGAVRIGRISWKILGEQAAEADIGLHGSFAMTYRGHGTDKALIAGILGMKPDDENIPKSFEIAKSRGLNFRFAETRIPNAHPNTAILHLTGVNGTQCTVEGVSVGGGSILITKLNGMDSAFNGEQDTLIIAHNDVPGVIAAVASKLAASGVNIGNLRLNRPRKGQLAITTVELDVEIKRSLVKELRALPDIISIVYMHAAN
ncbi:MAG: L-serine ammonia-lyase, iron-sulfur-dependent subunit beta [Clostridiales bacterium]|nr:L-serine ammonia-lyase, iron-sulfur-dependent subunit beta [Clostridiales bacterium]